MNSLGITYMFYNLCLLENIRISTDTIQLVSVKDWTITIILVIALGCVVYKIIED